MREWIGAEVLHLGAEAEVVSVILKSQANAREKPAPAAAPRASPASAGRTRSHAQAPVSYTHLTLPTNREV